MANENKWQNRVKEIYTYIADEVCENNILKINKICKMENMTLLNFIWYFVYCEIKKLLLG